MNGRPLVLLLITDAGGGHRASAEALVAGAGALEPGLDLQVVNVYRDIWSGSEPLKRLTGFYGEDVYNFTLDHDIRVGAAALSALGRMVARLPRARAHRECVDYLRARRPALCVSMMPFVNDSLAAACGEAGVPFALALIDPEDTQPGMWYTPRACGEAVWVTAPSATALGQARAAGARCILDCGVPLHPRYLEASLRALERGVARHGLGLDPKPLTLLLATGGRGSGRLEGLVDDLELLGLEGQVLVACGRNGDLRARLDRRERGALKVLPLDFTRDLPLYLRAADLALGKPGPGSLFEAVAAATPLVLDAQRARPHEVPNAVLAERHGLAVVVRRRRDLPGTLLRLARDEGARRGLERAQLGFPLGDATNTLARAVAGTVKGA